MLDARLDCPTQSRIPQNVSLAPDGQAVRIIDQSMLPNEVRMLDLRGAAECHDAIARLAVRGAPAIGVFAGYALYVLARGICAGNGEAFAPGDEAVSVGEAAQFDSVASSVVLASLQRVSDYLEGSRPTAVNLRYALVRMMAKARSLAGQSAGALLDGLRDEAESIHQGEIDTTARMAELGLSLLDDGMGIITHCNAGPLATCGLGTALGPVLLGAQRGMRFKVFADETRPLLQGARLTAYELSEAGVDVTLICDNMASIVMSQGWVQACLVGCDRVAANGDAANKIGTSGLAIIAKHYGVPFYVMCPTSTIDYACASGEQIPIELRDGDEIKAMWYKHPMAPEGVACYNPSFDVTDHDLITAIVTERGICQPPFSESLAAIRA